MGNKKPPPKKVKNARRLARKLIRWFDQHGRDLPWRRRRDPYAVWISEIMLQQTQVKTVIPYFERWMRALPRVADLARARPQRVLKLWEGLGYYSRARHAQAAARIIVKQHGGRFPENLQDLLALPGVGRYTAGAICSIAFNLPAPILDGNVRRVLSRLLGVAGDSARGQRQALAGGARTGLRRRRPARPAEPGPDGIRRVDLPAAPAQLPRLPRAPGLPGTPRKSNRGFSGAGAAGAGDSSAIHRAGGPPEAAAFWCGAGRPAV